MKQILHSITIALLAAICSAMQLSATPQQPAAPADTTVINMPETPFEYPMAPDSLRTLQERTSYVMLRFWDNADMKNVLADTTKFNKAFHDFVSFVPYSHPDSIKRSVSILVDKLGGKPENLLRMARRAEAELYGPEAEFWSETAYMMFLRPVLSNKKIKPKNKEYYLAQIKKLNSSQIGSSFPQLTYTTRHDAAHNMTDYDAEYKYVIFQPTDCADCSFTRLRLEADGATSSLIENGRLKIFIITPEKVDSTWKSDMERYPYTWEVGYMPDAADLVDLRVMPRTYILDRNNHIVARDVNIDQILSLSTAIFNTPEVTDTNQ